MNTREIEAAHEALQTAMLAADATALDRLLHADLTYAHSNAKVESKAEAIAALLAPGGAPKAVEYREGAFRLYSGSAIYTGKLNWTTAAGVTVPLLVLMIWVETPQGWQLAARQATRVP